MRVVEKSGVSYQPSKVQLSLVTSVKVSGKSSSVKWVGISSGTTVAPLKL